MFGAILKTTNSSFQKGMTFCRSIYVKKVMKLLAFIFEQPSYSMIVKLLTEHHLEFLSLRRLKRLVRVCTCQNVKLLEISCGGSYDTWVDLFPYIPQLFVCQ